MKIVINHCWGGFGISEQAKKELGIEAYGCDETEYRDDENLINLIEERGSKWCSDKYACLQIEEIPDDATDWIVNDYDGMESIIYVQDGKIKYS